MAEPATEKQIAFAKKLGIEGAEGYSKQVLREMIAKQQNSQNDAPKPQNQAPQHRAEMVETQIHIHRNERANSYEFGKAGDRFKVYFEDAKDLQAKLKELKDAGFYVEFETEKIA